jgi:hypothetical protein
VSLVRPEVGALEAITRSEVAMQLDSAHRYPRSVTKFILQEALSARDVQHRRCRELHVLDSARR